MPDYRVAFARPARKELEALREPIASRVLRRIESLAVEPRPADCRKLEGSRDLWRIRISDYRVVYRIDDASRLIDVTIVRHRSDAYR